MNNENVIWKKVKGYSRYEYSNTGLIRSTNYKRSNKKVILKPALDGGYYKTVLLNDDNKYKTVRIHVVIMISECDKPSLEHEVNHIDGNKLNNSINNLEWLTHSENIQHSFDNKLQIPLKGENNPAAKLTRDQVNFLRNEKKTKGRFWGRNKYALEFGVTAKHIQEIVNGNDLWK